MLHWAVVGVRVGAQGCKVFRLGLLVPKIKNMLGGVFGPAVVG